ncbi:MAG: hypothetical protein QXS81_05020 [Candidatus Micrarchaeaceae archaeon]
MTTQKEKDLIHAKNLWEVSTMISFATALFLFMFMVTNVWPSYTPLATYTKTINMNMNSSGILAVNITFSNYTIVKVAHIVIYNNYKINSASEELPNGTTITPAISYADKQLEIYCNTSHHNLLGYIDPNAPYWYYYFKC